MKYSLWGVVKFEDLSTRPTYKIISVPSVSSVVRKPVQCSVYDHVFDIHHFPRIKIFLHFSKCLYTACMLMIRILPPPENLI